MLGMKITQGRMDKTPEHCFGRPGPLNAVNFLKLVFLGAVLERFYGRKR
jgi:hypothetical protein